MSSLSLFLAVVWTIDGIVVYSEGRDFRHIIVIQTIFIATYIITRQLEKGKI